LNRTPDVSAQSQHATSGVQTFIKVGLWAHPQLEARRSTKRIGRVHEGPGALISNVALTAGTPSPLGLSNWQLREMDLGDRETANRRK
jgi:hypothetical protein